MEATDWYCVKCLMKQIMHLHRYPILSVEEALSRTKPNFRKYLTYILVQKRFERLWCYIVTTHQPGLCSTAHNWQKLKRTFLTCHCHNIYREEEVGPAIFISFYEIMIFLIYMLKFW